MVNNDQEMENNPLLSEINDFINRHTSLPTDDALVPINPTKIPSYYFGSEIETKRFHAAVGESSIEPGIPIVSP